MDALFLRRLNIWTKFFFGHEHTLGKILRANGALARDKAGWPADSEPPAGEIAGPGGGPAPSEDLGAFVENRILALEARVQTLEINASENAKASRQLKELAGAVAEAHLKFRGDLISLVDDHIEVLKLVQGMARHYDGETGKMILAYIHSAEGRLEHFQRRFAELNEAGERLNNRQRVRKMSESLSQGNPRHARPEPPAAESFESCSPS